MYILIMYITKLGSRFPKFVRFRNEGSFTKHVKAMLVKKNPDPDSIQLRTVVSTAPFDNIKSVAQTS